ncbi:MAG TPA: DUF2304 domain-containing protein [Candidatus Saccharimonadales bacterium]|nr:DUF2304 domain-containing protein [Candidatus Saccharimonadales bacterium]
MSVPAAAPTLSRTPQLVAGATALLLAVYVLNLVRRRKLTEEFSVLWLMATVAITVLAFWRNALHTITRLFGAVYDTSTIFFFGFVFVFLSLLQQSMKLSRLEQENRDLARALALEQLRREEHRD